jgi:hypothetical protein
MAENQWSDDFRDPQEPPRRADSSRDQWEGEPPPKPGMSGGMKAFLILVAVLGTCCLLCCGVVGFFAYQMRPKISQTPADVNAARDEIAKINLPAGFEPKNMVKIDNFMISMIVVEYHNAAVNGEITLAQMQIKIGEAAQRDQAMRQQLDRQGMSGPKNLSNAKIESKTIKIKGQECNFTFKQGTEPGTKRKMRQVSGVFEGSHGPVMISIEMDESAFKEDAIVKMLEGIN